MVVYRIEHFADKRGIWHPNYANAGIKQIEEARKYHDRLRNPGIEFGVHVDRIDTPNLVCAFPSKEVLLHFTPKEVIRRLFTLGFVLVELDIKNCRAYGEYTQVIFDRQCIELETILTIEDI